MKDNFQKSLEIVLKHEGGFVNHPSDPGGMTNLGVTKAVWEEWVGHPVDEKIMRGLTPDRVAPMYKRKYWDKCLCDELPLGVDFLTFDFAVNAGVGRSIKTLQNALGCVSDGSIGPNTMKAMRESDKQALIDKFSKAKEDFYRSLKTFDTFGKGWLKRVEESKIAAESMIGNQNG